MKYRKLLGLIEQFNQATMEEDCMEMKIDGSTVIEAGVSHGKHLTSILCDLTDIIEDEKPTPESVAETLPEVILTTPQQYPHSKKSSLFSLEYPPTKKKRSLESRLAPTTTKSADPIKPYSRQPSTSSTEQDRSIREQEYRKKLRLIKKELGGKGRLPRDIARDLTDYFTSTDNSEITIDSIKDHLTNDMGIHSDLVNEKWSQYVGLALNEIEAKKGLEVTPLKQEHISLIIDDLTNTGRFPEDSRLAELRNQVYLGKTEKSSKLKSKLKRSWWANMMFAGTILLSSIWALQYDSNEPKSAVALSPDSSVIQTHRPDGGASPKPQTKTSAPDLTLEEKMHGEYNPIKGKYDFSKLFDDDIRTLNLQHSNEIDKRLEEIDAKKIHDKIRVREDAIYLACEKSGFANPEFIMALYYHFGSAEVFGFLDKNQVTKYYQEFQKNPKLGDSLSLLRKAVSVINEIDKEIKSLSPVKSTSNPNKSKDLSNKKLRETVKYYEKVQTIANKKFNNLFAGQTFDYQYFTSNVTNNAHFVEAVQNDFIDPILVLMEKKPGKRYSDSTLAQKDVAGPNASKEPKIDQLLHYLMDYKKHYPLSGSEGQKLSSDILVTYLALKKYHASTHNKQQQHKVLILGPQETKIPDLEISVSDHPIRDFNKKKRKPCWDIFKGSSFSFNLGNKWNIVRPGEKVKIHFQADNKEFVRYSGTDNVFSIYQLETEVVNTKKGDSISIPWATLPGEYQMVFQGSVESGCSIEMRTKIKVTNKFLPNNPVQAVKPKIIYQKLVDESQVDSIEKPKIFDGKPNYSKPPKIDEDDGC